MVTRRITLTIGIGLATLSLLAGCTRNRATPEPTATVAEAQISVITNTGSLDPIVTVVPADVAAAAVVTATQVPAAGTLTPATIDYYVVDGDTLSIVAEKFQVETETIRQLNYLLTDDIFVGQILRMPYREGITAEGAPTPTPAPFTYAVETGDSLGTIAQQFGVSAVAIMEANELQDPNSVYIGQVLEIPGYAAPAAAETGAGTTATIEGSTTGSAANAPGSETGISHVVQPGETLLGIAQKYGVDANTIAEANNVTNRNQLRVGQQMIIPGITQRDAAAALGRIHTVQSGESLTAIAQLYGVTGDEIISFNNISNPDAIYVGQELIIPGP